eukprot:GILJ01002177.1.p1 GENE.GILJ01002177.1~~GILJ01002177.1.p1  ORF type:complete len:268 (-),score=22.94 GILJ01002177.1:205-1008(-)
MAYPQRPLPTYTDDEVNTYPSPPAFDVKNQLLYKGKIANGLFQCCTAREQRARTYVWVQSNRVEYNYPTATFCGCCHVRDRGGFKYFDQPDSLPWRRCTSARCKKPNCCLMNCHPCEPQCVMLCCSSCKCCACCQDPGQTVHMTKDNCCAKNFCACSVCRALPLAECCGTTFLPGIIDPDELIDVVYKARDGFRDGRPLAPGQLQMQMGMVTTLTHLPVPQQISMINLGQAQPAQAVQYVQPPGNLVYASPVQTVGQPYFDVNGTRK